MRWFKISVHRCFLGTQKVRGMGTGTVSGRGGVVGSPSARTPFRVEAVSAVLIVHALTVPISGNERTRFNGRSPYTYDEFVAYYGPCADAEWDMAAREFSDFRVTHVPSGGLIAFGTNELGEEV